MAYKTQVVTDIGAINRSGTPITSGYSANTVNQTAASLGSLGAINQNLVNNIMSLVKENTNANNAWSAAQAQKHRIQTSSL